MPRRPRRWRHCRFAESSEYSAIRSTPSYQRAEIANSGRAPPQGRRRLRILPSDRYWPPARRAPASSGSKRATSPPNVNAMHDSSQGENRAFDGPRAGRRSIAVRHQTTNRGSGRYRASPAVPCHRPVAAAMTMVTSTIRVGIRPGIYPPSPTSLAPGGRPGRVGPRSHFAGRDSKPVLLPNEVQEVGSSAFEAVERLKKELSVG